MRFNAFVRNRQEGDRKVFLEQADALLARQRDGRWEWTVDIPSRSLRAPWISGLSQSLGVSLLLRAYQHSRDERYLRGADAAFRWLAAPLSEGGVALADRTGTWFEEYPNADNPSHVLNGHLFALFGIWDYHLATGDATAKRLFKSGVAVLKANIAIYDVGYWVTYDALNRVDFVNGDYLQFIIEQLHALHGITKNKTFFLYANKWKTYLTTETLFVKLAEDEWARRMGEKPESHSW
jgi:hypothetical protein